MKIATLTTGASVVTTVTLTYVPQYLFYVAATQLTGLKATVYGDGTICDLDASGLTSIGRIRVQGIVTNGYLIPLADGLVKGKTLELIFTNSAAQTPDVYAIAEGSGKMYIQSLRQTALALSGIDLNKFFYAAFPSAAAADVFNITFSDGTVHKYERAELQVMKGLLGAVDNAAADYIFDNLQQNIKNINFIPAAAQTVYITRAAMIGAVKSSVITQSM